MANGPLKQLVFVFIGIAAFSSYFETHSFKVTIDLNLYVNDISTTAYTHIKCLNMFGQSDSMVLVTLCASPISGFSSNILKVLSAIS